MNKKPEQLNEQIKYTPQVAELIRAVYAFVTEYQKPVAQVPPDQRAAFHDGKMVPRLANKLNKIIKISHNIS